MTAVTRERLLAEATHLPRETDPDVAALRWAILVEDVLDVVLTDDQILTGPPDLPSFHPR